MTAYINLDSAFRNVRNYPNAADYQITGEEINGWFNTVASMMIRRNGAFHIRVCQMTLPYHPSVDAEAQLYVQFSDTDRASIGSLMTINGHHAYSPHVMVQSNVQRDVNGVPIWIHYHSVTDQTAFMSKEALYSFRIFRRNGKVLDEYTDDPNLPVDMRRQTLITLSVSALQA